MIEEKEKFWIAFLHKGIDIHPIQIGPIDQEAYNRAVADLVPKFKLTVDDLKKYSKTYVTVPEWLEIAIKAYIAQNEKDTVPKTPGSYSENINLRDSSIHFAFEPDPDYAECSMDLADSADTYQVTLRDGKFVNGRIFFSSLDDIEEFANELLKFAGRHKK